MSRRDLLRRAPGFFRALVEMLVSLDETRQDFGGGLEERSCMRVLDFGDVFARVRDDAVQHVFDLRGVVAGIVLVRCRVNGCHDVCLSRNRSPMAPLVRASRERGARSAFDRYAERWFIDLTGLAL